MFLDPIKLSQRPQTSQSVPPYNSIRPPIELTLDLVELTCSIPPSSTATGTLRAFVTQFDSPRIKYFFPIFSWVSLTDRHCKGAFDKAQVT